MKGTGEAYIECEVIWGVLWKENAAVDLSGHHAGGERPAFSLFLGAGGCNSPVSPVNESLWEHVKIIFWPYLLAAVWLNRGRPGGIRPWLLTLPLMCLVMLLLGYLYHITLGGEAMWVDIAIYVLVMVLGFWLPTQFSGPFQGVKWMLPVGAVLVLGILIAVFTLWPPEHILFVDLSSASAWFQIPC